ncbi:MAG: ABC transporter permease subunit [SAR324 cluster bacterium]|nr:ABC transporter permease subunit [SAR324 cluster bacterium]MCZ6646949.1 ABC transporter permease subunit [SAR324 cluster bacterium]
MKHAWPIIKRELMGYFRSPVAYVFIFIFLVSTSGTSWYLGNFYTSNEASLELFFFFHPWLYLFLIPAVGMRLWAEERRTGTMEILLTLPISSVTAVMSKFLAAWLFMGLSLLLTFPMILTANYLGDPDSGVMVTGYIGSFLMAGAYLAITSFTSSLTKNQVISFILSFMVCLILVMLGWGVLTRTLVEIFPVWLADLITQFSFTTHFNGLRRGIIDLRDVVYFASIIVVMLYANVLVLDNSRAK